MENYSARVKAEPGQAGPAYSSGGGQSLKNVLFTSLIISFSRIRVQLSEDPIRSHLLIGPIGVSLEQILQLLDQSEHWQLSGTEELCDCSTSVNIASRLFRKRIRMPLNHLWLMWMKSGRGWPRLRPRHFNLGTHSIFSSSGVLTRLLTIYC